MLRLWRRKRKGAASADVAPAFFDKREILDMYFRASETMTVVKFAREEEDQRKAQLEFSEHLGKVLKELPTIGHLYLYVWCSLSLGVASIEGLTQAIEHTQHLTAESILEALQAPEEVTDHLLSMLPDLSQMINFERIMQETAFQLSEPDEEPNPEEEATSG